jgi:hypothetical protein
MKIPAFFVLVWCGCFVSMVDSAVIAGCTFSPLILYRFRAELDRDFDSCLLVVLICMAGSFSPLVGIAMVLSGGAYSDSGIIV